MNITYSKEADALYLSLREGGDVDTTQEEEDGVILDYDKEGHVVGIEILDASRRIAHLVSDTQEPTSQTQSIIAAA